MFSSVYIIFVLENDSVIYRSTTYYNSLLSMNPSFQMTMFAVYIDYEKEYKFVTRFYRVTFLVTLFLTIFVYRFHNLLYQNETRFNIFFLIVTKMISYGQAGSVFKQYVVLLLCLRTRFKLINSLMR